MTALHRPTEADVYARLPHASQVDILDGADWQARRSAPGTVSGSDVGAILGIDGAGSAWDVWARRTGRPIPEPSPATRAAWDRGHHLERGTLEWYAHDIAGVHRGEPFPDEAPVVLYAAPANILVTGPEPWMVGSPDAIVFAAAHTWGVDAKTAGHGRGDWCEDTGDGATVPGRILAQAWWYMACTGLPRWDIATLHGGLDFRRYTVERPSPEHMERLVDLVREWRGRYLIGGETPPVDGSEACRAALPSLFRAGPAVRPMAETERDTVERYLAAKRASKAADAALALAENEVRAMIGDDAGIAVQGKDAVTWRLQDGARRIDSTRLRAEFPEVAEAITVQGEPTRVLRVSAGLLRG